MAADADLRRGFEFGPFTIIPERGIVRLPGEDTHLEPKQMDALVTLARHQPGVVSKDLLVEEVWGGRATADESIVQCIKGIRQALDKDDPREPKYIETIHGRGYRLMVPLRIPQPETPEAARMQVPRTWWIAGAAALLLLAVILIRSRGESELGSPSIESAVVMRFVNMSGDEYQYMVDGFTEQLISTLYQEPELRTLKGNLSADEAPRDIAQRYEVDSVVSGSVQYLDGEFTIRATVYAENSANQWGGSFNGNLQDMFDLHEQVATKVRDAIRGEAEESVTAPSKSADPEGFDTFMLGQFYLAKRDKASLDQATTLFKKSIEFDPAFGPAYLNLANTYMLLADYVAREAMYDLAIATAEEGVRQDPNIHDAAQTVHGYVHTKRGNWAAATDAFAVATRSSVEYPPSHHYLSRLMAAVGRLDDSLIAARRARDLEPDSQVLNSRLAIACMWTNDMACASRYYEFANTMGPGAPIHQLSYAMFLIRENRIDEAREVARRAMELYELDSAWVDPVFDELAKSPTSESTIAVLEGFAAQNTIPDNPLMTFWIIAGQADRAMEIAWKLVDDQSVLPAEMMYLDEFRILREHDDFPRFLDELGLTEYWEGANCRWDNNQATCNST